MVWAQRKSVFSSQLFLHVWQDEEVKFKVKVSRNVIVIGTTHVCVSLRQQRSLAGKACVSRMVVDKYVYLNKAGTPTVEVWDKRSERMVDCIDCAQIIRYTRACMHELTGFFYYLSLPNVVHDLLLQSTRMQLCVHFSLQTRLWL